MKVPSIFQFPGCHIHMVGIGGASMCGIAVLLQSFGFTVTGSDLSESSYTAYLREHGIRYTIGHAARNVAGANLVVYTAAVPKDNPEMAAAAAAGIPAIERAECLGQILNRYAQSIGVAGCHGKTTITAMLGRIFLDCGKDPSIHVGGMLDYLGASGTRLGSSDLMVIEACEFKDSFLHFHPKYAVINNIDDDHLDYFGNMDGIMRSFSKYLDGLQPGAVAFGCAEDARVLELLRNSGHESRTYGEHGDYQAQDLAFDAQGCGHFTVTYRQQPLAEVKLSVPGRHNVINALAAFAVSHTLGCSPQEIAAALGAFNAAQRRFQKRGCVDGVAIYHDYAHHPTEITATLQTARMLHPKKLIAVFQCYTYSRSYTLFDRFVEALKAADLIVIAEICGAREHDAHGQAGSKMAEALRAAGANAAFFPSFEEIADYLATQWQPGDLVVTMGAGDIGPKTDLLLKAAEK